MTADLSGASNEELASEMARRQILPPCRCRKWQTYLGTCDSDGYTLRCHGCLRAIARCTCG